MATKSPCSSSAEHSITNVTLSNRQLNIYPFQPTKDTNETAVLWGKWLKNIERQFRYFGISDAEAKKDGLIIYGGQQIADLEDTLPDSTGDGDQYKTCVEKLNKHFLPKKNKDFARSQFGNLKQEGESLMNYHTRIKEVAKECAFPDENKAIRDHLFKTMRNNTIRFKTIRKNWKLEEILEEAELDEEAHKQASAIEKNIDQTDTVNRIESHQRRVRARSKVIISSVINSEWKLHMLPLWIQQGPHNLSSARCWL
ncbi:hypothetical protein QZH41_004124 [Actinostola sp. cb2023]|nr:hypothetical protein QZH41_004124 [Actinostola sp. cb2023]